MFWLCNGFDQNRSAIILMEDNISSRYCS